MSKKLIYLLLAVSIGLNIGVITTTIVHRATRVPPPRPGGPPGDGQRDARPPQDPVRFVEDHVRRITRHLDLDSEQQQAIRTVLERHAPQLMEFQADVAETGQRLADAFGAPAFDPEQFRQLTAEASAARVRLDSLSAVMLVAEAGVLAPEQRRKFAEVAPSIQGREQRRPPREGRPSPR